MPRRVDVHDEEVRGQDLFDVNRSNNGFKVSLQAHTAPAHV